MAGKFGYDVYLEMGIHCIQNYVAKMLQNAYLDGVQISVYAYNARKIQGFVYPPNTFVDSLAGKLNAEWKRIQKDDPRLAQYRMEFCGQTGREKGSYYLMVQAFKSS